MSDPRYDDPDLTHRAPLDAHGEVRPTDAIYAGDGGGLRADTTAPHARPRSNRWGRIALVAAAVILGLALVSALFTGVDRKAAELATTRSADPVVTGTVSDTGTVVVADPETMVVPGESRGVVPVTDTLVGPAN